MKVISVLPEPLRNGLTSHEAANAMNLSTMEVESSGIGSSAVASRSPAGSPMPQGVTPHSAVRVGSGIAPLSPSNGSIITVKSPSGNSVQIFHQPQRDNGSVGEKFDDLDYELLVTLAKNQPLPHQVSAVLCAPAAPGHGPRRSHQGHSYLHFEPIGTTANNLMRWEQEVDRSVLLIVAQKRGVPTGLLSLTAVEVQYSGVEDFEIFRSVAEVAGADPTGPMYQSPSPLGFRTAVSEWTRFILKFAVTLTFASVGGQVSKEGSGQFSLSTQAGGDASSATHHPPVSPQSLAGKKSTDYPIPSFFKKLPSPAEAANVARSLVAVHHRMGSLSPAKKVH